MKFHPITLPLLLLLSTAGLGCLWINGTTLTGHRVSIHGSRLTAELRRAQATDLRMVTHHHSSASETPVQPSEKEALDHILNGRFSAAVPLLEKAEAQSPGNYSTAANLGTVYELVGRNADALRLIREGMRRNPGSHEGTEWVHEMILVRKVENETTGRISKLPLIPLPDSFEPSTKIQAGGIAREVNQIQKAIEYQLLERMTFVKPKDPYVADLLLTLALIQSRFQTLETAMELLEMASDYGHPDTGRVDGLKSAYAKIIKEANFWENVRLLFYLLVGCLFVGGCIASILKIFRRLRAA